jgi:hypothetical protein
MTAWLSSLTATELARLLRARPDAVGMSEPRDLAELANRWSSTPSIQRALPELDLPALQVAEALLALGGHAEPSVLHALLGADDPVTAAQVDAAADELTRLALAWPTAAGLRLAGGWRDLLPDPLGLGRSGRELYGLLTDSQLGRVGALHGLTGRRRRAEWVRAVVVAVSDPGTVEERLARAGPEVAAAVRKVAWHGPRVAGVRFPGTGDRAARDVGELLCEHGWVVPTVWGDIGEMPREVALAVRGTGYRAPFTPEPVAPATAAVDGSRVAAAGWHAASTAVESVRRLLALLDRTPLAQLQAGGVGVRELRRAAKLLSVGESAVRLWLEIAAAAGLVLPTAEEVLVSTAAESWLEAEPGAALARLLVTWWRLPVPASNRRDETGRPAPALGWAAVLGPGAERLRADLLEALAALSSEGPVRGIVDPDGLAELIAHRRPLTTGGPDAAAHVRDTLAEATLLGLVADGALTPLGAELRAAVATDDPEDALAAAVAGTLPAPAATATFLPDLTAVVRGAAAPSLARLLDEVAESRSRDTASTWRFDAAGVRRALDAGWTADTLLAALADVADRPLPQPLEYLVHDVARRHGQLRVFPVACCVEVADAALADEVQAHRALAPLRLRPLAGTLLASTKPVVETVRALREAGYAPVRTDARGETVVERTPTRRADARPRVAPATRSRSLDVAELARRLARKAGG